MKKIILTGLFTLMMLISFAFSNVEKKPEMTVKEDALTCTIIINYYDIHGKLISTTRYHTSGSCETLLALINSNQE